MYFWYLVCLEAADTPQHLLLFSLRGDVYINTNMMMRSARRRDEYDSFSKTQLEPIAEAAAEAAASTNKSSSPTIESSNSSTSIVSSTNTNSGNNNNSITTSTDAGGQVMYSVPVSLPPPVPSLLPPVVPSYHSVDTAPNVLNLTSKMEEMRQLIQEYSENSADNTEILNVDK